MPTLIEETEIRLTRSDLERRIVLPRELNAAGFIAPPKRTPGLHLSGLLKYIAVKTKISTYVQSAAELDEIKRYDHNPLRWFLGQIVEEGLASLWPEMTWQPGEQYSPVIFNPDGIHHDPKWGFVIDEFKNRRAKRFAGAKDMLSKQWAWAHQGMGECVGMGTPFVQWHVFSMFEFPDPVYHTYLIQFSDEELAGMARMIEVNKDEAIREGYSE